MFGRQPTRVQKACAYITRNEGTELLVFQGPDHDGLQIPKGTIEPGESPQAAVRREVAEESGLVVTDPPREVATDRWIRQPGRTYVRHFYHFDVAEPRDEWTHVVTGDGEETGQRFQYFWVALPTNRPFALALDDYLSQLCQELAA
ncbi:8-oxo-dGTP pyrophosphatase MutT, NUDIX family [Halogranum rubrum]|uniref:8-oxo-dGTP pyrophosphatase MutT, NUDIX family n=1 Tax=Halogranum rubrum TaxID=553466 RepID=A0A1I4BQ63_9EURY|nr:8-oxo-dGTP pyrophosphatase MutT, NUDIX family [Halogranum rubrum]